MILSATLRGRKVEVVTDGEYTLDYLLKCGVDSYVYVYTDKERGYVEQCTKGELQDFKVVDKL